jgi:hypothetical protein
VGKNAKIKTLFSLVVANITLNYIKLYIKDDVFDMALQWVGAA